MVCTVWHFTLFKNCSHSRKKKKKVFLFSLLLQNVKDVAVVALPFAENEIRKSVNMILDAVVNVTEIPNQVIAITKRAIMG